MLREILEKKGKWVFTKSDPSMSGTPTLTMTNEYTEFTIYYSKADKVWGVFVSGDEDFADKYDGQGGFDDLMGPQGDYSAVEYSSENLGDALNALNKVFKVNINKKDWEPLTNYVLGV